MRICLCYDWQNQFERQKNVKTETCLDFPYIEEGVEFVEERVRAQAKRARAKSRALAKKKKLEAFRRQGEEVPRGYGQGGG